MKKIPDTTFNESRKQNGSNETFFASKFNETPMESYLVWGARGDTCFNKLSSNNNKNYYYYNIRSDTRDNIIKLRKYVNSYYLL